MYLSGSVKANRGDRVYPLRHSLFYCYFEIDLSLLPFNPGRDLADTTYLAKSKFGVQIVTSYKTNEQEQDRVLVNFCEFMRLLDS